jgi:hypothetical protein
MKARDMRNGPRVLISKLRHHASGVDVAYQRAVSFSDNAGIIDQDVGVPKCGFDLLE